MISIIIPIYNQANFLENCLKQISKQTYQNFEVIVINDGSTDNIIEVIGKCKIFMGDKLEFLEQENKGANAARNRGVKLAKGEYLLFCDADVEMYPDMLEKMHTALKNNPQASFSYSSFLWGRKRFSSFAYDDIRLKIMPYINVNSMVRKEHFPGFDEDLKKFQEWDLWLNMLINHNHRGVWIDKVLYKVNIGGSQTMSSWLPKFAYRWLPFLTAVKKYNTGMELIKKKYNLQ